MNLVDVDVEALPLGPPREHPQQHVRPILGLGAARPRLDRRDRIVRVVLPGQERFELDPFEILLEPLDRGGELLGELGIDGVRQQVVDRDRVLEAAPESVEPLERRAQPSELGRDPPALRGVVPERGIGGLGLQLIGLCPFRVDVKGTPEPR
jgi:hypothetical protein